jgi:beta-N-acetylhexosaminidase
MLIIGLEGVHPDARERILLRRPEVSGVILFRRNFASRDQLHGLVDQLREIRPDPLLICVDQEGGPVQRLAEDGFFRLPPLERIGALWEADPDAARQLAHEHAWLMASEVLALGLDLSFAPVADLGRGNRAIGVRALHADPAVAGELVAAYVQGMHEAGMAATLKHFPGHGSVVEDTHFDVAHDPRSLDELREADLVPFARGIAAGAEAVMMAHVEYPQVAPLPAGYADRWIDGILRGDMGFEGVVVSDDIGMAAAHGAGGVAARVGAHLDAGCDLVLACAPALVEEALDACIGSTPCTQSKLASLRARQHPAWEDLLVDERHAHCRAKLAPLCRSDDRPA